MTPDDAALNYSHKLHLLSSAQHADKLLSDVEAILAAAASKSAFKKYKNSLSPLQVKVIEDYIARIRAQMVRVLESQGVALPEPAFESVHSIRVMLSFVRIAFQECTPDRMRGYGAFPETKVRELNGLVDEMVGAVDKLDAYLAQGLGQNLAARLQKLEQVGADTGVLTVLERIVNRYGFVEFRPALAMILDRLETKSFEIALFGRVSSGKSSLLNHMIGAEILPVGVNPITAVPTRLMYGPARRLTVSYANRSPEVLDTERLPEFVSEHHNPGNYRHVARIVVELPSPRLRDGVVLVDTPGLGSLATSGAAETLAYLPRCDLGVVLIDAGSTLTEDDLSTIRMLYEAGIPASVLLSKGDLLAAEDRAQSLAYIAGQLQSRLGLTIAVHPVSVQPSHAGLLDAWLAEVIAPLYDRHQQLAEDSLRRKIGSLRETVETALKTRLERAPAPGVDADRLDAGLRSAVGRIAEVRESCFEFTRKVRSGGEDALAEAAVRLARVWSQGGRTPPGTVVHDALVEYTAAAAGELFRTLRDLAGELARTLDATAAALGFKEPPSEDDLASVIKEMPRLDLGTLEVDLGPGALSRVSAKAAVRHAERGLSRQIGAEVVEAFSNFGSLLTAWMRRTLADLQLRFDSHADGYRAHLDRLERGGHLSGAEAEAMDQDLAALAGVGGEAWTTAAARENSSGS
jgi:GTP-binding protein EngB required for normal cell division